MFDAIQMVNQRSESRFALVTAAHHLLLQALPFRHPESELALQQFVLDASACQLSEPDRDAILVRCLRILDRHTGGRVPTLVEQYLAYGSDPRGTVHRFSACVRHVLKYRGVEHPKVQRAVAIIDERYGDSELSQHEVAMAVDACTSTFCTQFKQVTGATFTQFLRDYRLDRAAALLADTTKSVKEVWAAVGYNHASNFAHDFKRRFGVSAREHRRRVLRPAAQEDHLAGRIALIDPPSEKSGPHKTVLVVDDDRCTREMISACLRFTGYAVDVASCGTEGLRAADGSSPDAILLDYWLSDMDGLSFLRALREKRTSVPVAIFTADWDIYNREAEVASLGATVCSKLCDPGAIETLVALLIGQD